jgi:hypothetical protein
MEFLTALWLPILLSAVFVFVVSSIIHMATPMHKGDQKQIPNENTVLDTLRTQGVKAGMYAFPYASCMKDMGSEEMLAKLKQGPCGFLVVLPPGGFQMGRSLVMWFIYSLLVGLFVAYVTWHGLGAGADYRTVFRVAGAAAVLGYAFGYLQDPIWKGASWSTSIKFVIDGVIYGLVTAGTFGWLWPDA